MKKRMLLLGGLLLFLVGCNVNTEEVGMGESSVIPEVEIMGADAERESGNEFAENNAENNVITEINGKIYEASMEEESEEEDSEIENIEEIIWGSNDWDDDLEYTVTVLDERMEVDDEIPTSDRIHLQYGHDGEDGESIIFWAFIEDGEFYYYRGINEGFIGYSNNMTENERLKKMTLLNQIRRMKTFNLGSGVDPVPYLITESGEVYSLYDTWPSYDEQMKLVKFDMLEGYQVEDILEFDSEWSYNLKVLLKDGTVIEIHSESWG